MGNEGYELKTCVDVPGDACGCFLVGTKGRKRRPRARKGGSRRAETKLTEQEPAFANRSRTAVAPLERLKILQQVGQQMANDPV